MGAGSIRTTGEGKIGTLRERSTRKMVEGSTGKTGEGKGQAKRRREVQKKLWSELSGQRGREAYG